jgi:2',3'-cyclic-nucleotide 2'-phosphodiesterase (5'-nucleotidase family)
VTIKTVDGKPFDENATYAVITNDFCASGGDTYNAFHRAFEQGHGFDTGIPMDEAFTAYINDVMNGVIGEQYASPRAEATQILP